MVAATRCPLSPVTALQGRRPPKSARDLARRPSSGLGAYVSEDSAPERHPGNGLPIPNGPRAPCPTVRPHRPRMGWFAWAALVDSGSALERQLKGHKEYTPRPNFTLAVQALPCGRFQSSLRDPIRGRPSRSFFYGGEGYQCTVFGDLLYWLRLFSKMSTARTSHPPEPGWSCLPKE